MRTIFVLAVLFLGSCASVPAQEELPAPQGQLLASIKTTSGANNGRTKPDTGYLFYVETPSNVAGPLLTGYEIVDGRSRDVFGGASDSAKVIEAIEAVGLEPFDLRTEISETTLRLSKPGLPFLGPVCVVADGADYEIVITTVKGQFSLRGHEPGCEIEAYSPYSPKIAKLKTVLDLLAQYYGRTKFGV